MYERDKWPKIGRIVVISLKDTNLRGVKGLAKEQLAACKAKGAIIDADSMTNASQSTVTTPSLSQSNDPQASSTPETDL